MSGGGQSPVRLPREGSSARYTLLFCEPEDRPGLQALAAFRAEIDSVVLFPVDASVRNLKLGWWGEEILRLRQGEPRHPVTRALQPYRSAVQSGLLEAFMDISVRHATGPAGAGHDFPGYCYASGATLAELASLIPGTASDDVSLRRAASELGAAIRATALARLSLAAPGLTRCIGSALGESETARIGEALIRGARKRFRLGFEGMPLADRPRQRGLLIMAALYQRLLDKLDAAPVGRRVELNPLTKLWVAWKTARAAGQPAGTGRE